MKILIITGIALLFFTSCQTRPCDEKRVLQIGQSFLNTVVSKQNQGAIPDVVNVGDGLIKQLEMLKETKEVYKLAVETGDLEQPYGDNSSDCVLKILSDSNSLSIRLKYNNNVGKYDIKGW